MKKIWEKMKKSIVTKMIKPFRMSLITNRQDLSDDYYIIKTVLLVHCITSSLISTYLVGTQV